MIDAGDTHVMKVAYPDPFTISNLAPQPPQRPRVLFFCQDPPATPTAFFIVYLRFVLHTNPVHRQVLFFPPKRGQDLIHDCALAISTEAVCLIQMYATANGVEVTTTPRP